ncbi:MAG TPA: tyrosine-type recombinase/integrase [Methanomassiliicoccales archaeon]|nr:tyrosine-type recombinase/integrase [Methanomassiliicoccales archaeon]
MGAKVIWNRQRNKWYVRVYDNGREWKEPVGPDRTEAEAVTAQIERDLSRRRKDRLAGRICFEPGASVNGERAFRWWAANYRFKRSTAATNRSALEQHLVPFFGDMDLRYLTHLDIRRFADSRFEAGKSEATVSNAVSLLRRVINLLIETQVLSCNPVPRMMKEVAESARAHPERQPTRNRDAWTPEEAWTLMDVAESRERAWAPIFFFYFQTGARLGEGIALKWDAVNLVDGDIHIRRAVSGGEEGDPKWGKDRHVPIANELHGLLRRVARDRQIADPWTSPEYVFLSPRGCRIDKDNLERAWNRVRTHAHAKHGVRPFSLHSFRHTWVSTMLRSGEDPQWVAKCVGDSLDVIYKHYSHAIANQQRDLTALSRPQASVVASRGLLQPEAARASHLSDRPSSPRYT